MGAKRNDCFPPPSCDRIFGDQLIFRYDAPRGRSDAARAKEGLAAQVAAAHAAPIQSFLDCFKPAVPLTKPCCLIWAVGYPEGMTDIHARTQL